MLTKFAVLIAFESFARFVHSTNRIVPSGSLSAKAMKTAGIPVEQIAEMTRLSVEEISGMV